MKVKNHQISNNNKNIVYVINNVPTPRRRRRQLKKKSSDSSTNDDYSPPPEQSYRAPDNRFKNTSNLNTEVQRAQLNNLMGLKEKAYEEQLFKVQNSLKEEQDNFNKANYLYSRFDSAPRFQDSVNNIFGVNQNDNQGTFGETSGSENFIHRGDDEDEYIEPSPKLNSYDEISYEQGNTPIDTQDDTSSISSAFNPVDLFPSPIPTNEKEIVQEQLPTPEQPMDSGFISRFKSMKLNDTPQQSNMTSPRQQSIRQYLSPIPMTISNTPVSLPEIQSPQSTDFMSLQNSPLIDDVPDLMNVAETPFNNYPSPFIDDTLALMDIANSREQQEPEPEPEPEPEQEVRNTLRRRPTDKEVRQRLKEEYRALGGDNPIIFNTTRKKTLTDEIKRLTNLRQLREEYEDLGGRDPRTMNTQSVKDLRKAIKNIQQK